MGTTINKANSIYGAEVDNPADPAVLAGVAAGSSIIDFYEASGLEPDARLDTVSDTGQDTGQGAETDAELNTETSEAAAAADEYNPRPRCSFYSCFACEGGYCTALNDTDFHGRPCPFFKTVQSAEKDRQDAFDRLLIGGRLDVINRYEEVLVNLGIENPEDAGEGPLVIDDDILAARKAMEAFRRELEEAETEEAGIGESDAGEPKEDLEEGADETEYGLYGFEDGAGEAGEEGAGGTEDADTTGKSDREEVREGTDTEYFS